MELVTVMFDTPARQAARIRNHKIRTLRMIYTYAASQVSDISARTTILQLLDRELINLGAEAQSIRILRIESEDQPLEDNSNE
jgi:hypothetical protein